MIRDNITDSATASACYTSILYFLHFPPESICNRLIFSQAAWENDRDKNKLQWGLIMDHYAGTATSWGSQT